MNDKTMGKPMLDFSKRWVNLASNKLGAAAIACSDDFFAPMHRMLQEHAPLFIDGKYDEHGKWMDGWESRRKRVAGHDWCVVKLAMPGVLRAIDIDTAHFTGNYPPAAALDACRCDLHAPDSSTQWHAVIAPTDLQGDSLHQFEIAEHDHGIYTHIRLNIFPDGGVARLRVYGVPTVAWARMGKHELVDLASALNGAVALGCNDEHFGAIRNLLAPGRAAGMADGWETRRRRGPGNDWAIIALAHLGVIKKIDIDTAHFKGNYPDRCSLQGARLPATSTSSWSKNLPDESEAWRELLPPMKLEADHMHTFQQEVVDIGPITHARLNIYPDGGISRVRLFGAVAGEQ